LHVGPQPLRHLRTPAGGARIHRPLLAQRAETGMHLGAQHASVRSHRTLARPAVPGQFAQIFTDGDRFPHRQRAVPEHRHAPGRAVLRYLRSCIGPVERNQQFVERESQVAHQHPWAQRPR